MENPEFCAFVRCYDCDDVMTFNVFAYPDTGLRPGFWAPASLLDEHRWNFTRPARYPGRQPLAGGVPTSRFGEALVGVQMPWDGHAHLCRWAYSSRESREVADWAQFWDYVRRATRVDKVLGVSAGHPVDGPWSYNERCPRYGTRPATRFLGVFPPEGGSRRLGTPGRPEVVMAPTGRPAVTLGRPRRRHRPRRSGTPSSRDYSSWALPKSGG
jgi:hypothetical protein